MLLSIQEVRKSFPVQRGFWGKPSAFVHAVSGVSFDLPEEAMIGIVGESGCGKSTLGKCAVGLLTPTDGKVRWEGRNILEVPSNEFRGLRRSFQMVFQNPFSSLNPRQRVQDLLMEPMEVHGLLEPQERIPSVKDLLGQVGLSHSDLQKFPHEFSGGQRQRIALARALACRPRLMVLDEPLSSLDVSVQASILNLLVRLNRDLGIAYLFISHDLQVVGFLCQRILVMYLGKVVEEGEARKVLENPRHPYTEILSRASQGKDIRVEGEPPSPVHIPSGCAFHNRCPHAEKRCREEEQSLQEVEKGWKVACWKWDRIVD